MLLQTWQGSGFQLSDQVAIRLHSVGPPPHVDVPMISSLDDEIRWDEIWNAPDEFMQRHLDVSHVQPIQVTFASANVWTLYPADERGKDPVISIDSYRRLDLA